MKDDNSAKADGGALIEKWPVLSRDRPLAI